MLAMERLTPQALADHLEATLAATPPATLSALQDPDSRLRRRAVVEVAEQVIGAAMRLRGVGTIVSYQ